MEPSVSIVIPNYNGLRWLPDCLDAMRRQRRKPDLVVVVDNGSSDGSADFVRENYPETELILFPGNTGFCGAVNAGIGASREAGMDYCVLLNNDTRAEPEFTGELVAAMEANPRAFSCQAMMLSMADPGKIDDAGDLYCSLGWAFARGKGKPSGRFEKPCPVFFSCAGAAIYRMSALDEIGLFDERHFAYLEDCDIGWRARIHGWKNLYVPSARVLHAGSATTGSVYNLFKVKNTSRNSIYLISKNMPAWQIILNLPLLLPGFLVKAVFFAARGFGREYLAGIARGFRMSAEGRRDGLRVKPKPEYARSYAEIQLELWINVVRRLFRT